MDSSPHPRFTKRYKVVSENKADGATYTPKLLSDFVARKIVESAGKLSLRASLRVLDPAVGDGELLLSLLGQLSKQKDLKIEVCGFETNQKALDQATIRLKQRFPGVFLHLKLNNFLEYVLEHFGEGQNDHLFRTKDSDAYDLIIANPPYVRTQIMGAEQAQMLARQFGLSGRVDLYYPFILGMARVLKPQGTAGIIVSNRFMSTKSGSSVRRAILEQFGVQHVWDLGDTKLFDAAVLPSVLIVKGRDGQRNETPSFTSIYETTKPSDGFAVDPISALSKEGVIEIDDGRRFFVQHGKLNVDGTLDGVWRIATQAGEAWLASVENHTWGTFRDLGKIRVGVKTCGDKVFIRSDWDDIPYERRPELLRPVTTHHVARRYKAQELQEPRQILYPHETVQGKRRAIDLTQYPKDKLYLEQHRPSLESRKYVIDAGRKWYEIWVTHDPAIWDMPKLVFRDIAREPTFWIDRDRTVVNGDCYWLASQDPTQTDLLFLAAAIGNSTFIKVFYDYRFQNKLYAGRRRFMTQYVEKFPLPDPNREIARAIIRNAKHLYHYISTPEADSLEEELDRLVWQAFGLPVKEICR